ncbi:MAG TPA: ATP-binding protein [Propionibacteriaceae bacterium]|nr:ATP-binding protein [Propionibacteriaceae bacterium]
MELRSSPPSVWRGRLLVGCFTTAWVFAVYILLVVGGALALGQTERPNLPLSLLATAIVAVGFEPLRSTLRRRFAQSPYDRLAQFSTKAANTVATDDVIPELARRVTEGSGAVSTEVWLRSPESGIIELAARWPPAPDAGPGPPPARHYAIRHGDEELGELVVREQTGRPLEPIEERLVSDLCAQAGLALRHVQLTEDLRRRVAQSSERARELRLSRQRVVAAADAERRRLEANIHDGAQQHLIALAINLALARELLAHQPARLGPLLPALRKVATEATLVLDGLGRGIYPRQLAEEGVAAGIRSATASSALPIQVDDHLPCRYPREIEAAAYFVCLEAVQNAVKHARASHICVRLSAASDGLELEVTDDGQGFDVTMAAARSGTAHLRDRVETAGGHAEVISLPGVGTRVTARIPGRAAATAEPSW